MSLAVLVLALLHFVSLSFGACPANPRICGTADAIPPVIKCPVTSIQVDLTTPSCSTAIPNNSINIPYFPSPFFSTGVNNAKQGFQSGSDSHYQYAVRSLLSSGGYTPRVASDCFSNQCNYIGGDPDLLSGLLNILLPTYIIYDTDIDVTGFVPNTIKTKIYSDTNGGSFDGAQLNNNNINFNNGVKSWAFRNGVNNLEYSVRLSLTSTESVICISGVGDLVNVGYSDDCPNPQLTYTPSLTSLFPIGATQIVAKVTDSNNQVATCTVPVTVVDRFPPQFVCSSTDVIASIDATGQVSVPINSAFTTTPTDCSPITITPASGWIFTCSQIGLRNQFISVADSAGNSQSCTVNIMVNDVLAPVLTCQTSLVFSADTVISTSTVLISVTDNCPTGIVYELSQTSVTCYTQPSYTVVLTATDASGNVGQCTTVITMNCPSPSGTPTQTGTATTTITATTSSTTTLTATPTSTLSLTPTSSPTLTATPSTTTTLTATSTTTLTATPTSTLSLTPTSTTTLTATPTSTTTLTATPSTTLTATPTSTLSLTPTSTTTLTATPTSTTTLTATPTSTTTLTATTSSTNTLTATPTSSKTETATTTPSSSQSGTVTASSSQTGTPTASTTATQSNTASVTGTSSESATRTTSDTPTKTPSNTVTPTASLSASRSSTRTPTSTSSNTASNTASRTPTGSPSNTRTPTSSVTGSPSSTGSDSSTATVTPTSTSSRTSTITSTPSRTPTTTATLSASISVSATPGSSTSNTPTNSRTASSSATSSLTPSNTMSSSSSITSSKTSTSTPSNTATSTSSNTATGSATNTPTSSDTSSPTTTDTPTSSVSQSRSAGASPASTVSGTPSSTSSNTPSITPSGTPTRTSSPTSTNTPTGTSSSSTSPSETASSSATATRSSDESLSRTPTTTVTLSSTTSVTPSSFPSKSNSPFPSLSQSVALPSVSISLSETPTISSRTSPSLAPTTSSQSSMEILPPLPDIPSIILKSHTPTPIVDILRSNSRTFTPYPSLNTNTSSPIDIRNDTDTVGQVTLPPDLQGTTLIVNVTSPVNPDLASQILELTLIREDIEITQFRNSVLICITPNRDVDSGDVCLAFETPSGKFVCEDRCLKRKNGRLCGTTDHFTNFALLLTGDNNGGGSGGDSSCSNSDTDVVIWLSVGSIVGGCIFIILAIFAIEAHYQRNRKRERTARSLATVIKMDDQVLL